MEPFGRGGWRRKGVGLISLARHQGLMLNKTLCLVPPTVISCLGSNGEMFPQTRTGSGKWAMNLEGFGGAMEICRP